MSSRNKDYIAQPYLQLDVLRNSVLVNDYKFCIEVSGSVL